MQTNIDKNNTIKSIKSFFENNFLYKYFLSYIKMSQDLSNKYRKKKKKKVFKKKLMKGINIFLKEKKKCNNMVANNKKIFLSIRNKTWLSIEKIL